MFPEPLLVMKFRKLKRRYSSLHPPQYVFLNIHSMFVENLGDYKLITKTLCGTSYMNLKCLLNLYLCVCVCQTQKPPRKNNLKFFNDFFSVPVFFNHCHSDLYSLVLSIKTSHGSRTLLCCSCLLLINTIMSSFLAL